MAIFRALHRHLDPADTLGELIFGLIMVLTFTIGARLLGPDEPTDSRELLAAAIGCNLAWGIIDGFLYMLGRVYERRRLASLVERVQSVGQEPAIGMLEMEFASTLARMVVSDERRKFYASVVEAVRCAPKHKVGLTGDDLRGAVLVCCLVLATAIPAAVPFTIINDSYAALRVSNAVLVGLLFVVGFLWGGHVGARPWQAGALVMSVGLLLVLIAIPLGG
ncbi:MAG: hypothetical protein R3D05_12990 [Dongiaceae bacterium]